MRDRLVQRWSATRAPINDWPPSGSTTSRRVLDGRLLGNLLNLGLLRQHEGGARQTWGIELGGLLASKARRRPGQRGPRAAGGLLPGLDGHCAPGLRLRYPLRVRHLRPGDSATAGRWSAPRTGCARKPLGDSRGPRHQVPVAFGGRTEATGQDGRERVRWVDASACWAWPTTRPSPATATHREHPAPVAGRAPAEFDLAEFDPATTWLRSRRRTSPRPSPRCSIPTTISSRARTAPGAAVLLCVVRAAGYGSRPPASAPNLDERCRHQVGDPAQRHAPGHRHAELMRLPPGRAPATAGTRPGTSGRPLPTPITRCCPRPWRSGRCGSSVAVLPRHLEIIYEINRRFLDEVQASSTRGTSSDCGAVAHRREC